MNYLRLKKRKDISAVLKTGKRARGASLTVVYAPAERTEMAVCVGKKYGKSVERNRIKRLLREAFRLCAEVRPCRVLLIPRVAEEYSLKNFERDLGKIFRREHLENQPR